MTQRIADPSASRLPRGLVPCEAPSCPEAASTISNVHAKTESLRLCSKHWADALAEVESALKAGSVA